MRAALAAITLGLGAGAAIACAATAAATAPATAAADDGAHGPASAAAHRPAPSAGPHPRRGAVQASVQPALKVTRSGQSPFSLSSRGTTAAELSGITYAGGTTYYSVGDNGDKSIWQIYTSLNIGTGRIRSSLVTGAVSAPGLGADSEGIALRPGRDTVWVADEIASTITEFSLLSGQAVGAVGVPEIYRPANVVNNMGLESLTYGAGSLWTANEEALLPDGPPSTTSAGSWVRIQQFTGVDLAAAGQFAYRTDPISRMSPFVTLERSGLVELLALPDGQLLALERELGGILPRFRSRVYLLDLNGATDVTDVASLSDGEFTPVGKTLLWQGVFGFTNFEGMTLGPQRGDGSYTLLLVSDNGGGQLGQRQDTFTLLLGGLGAPSATSPDIAL